MNNYQVTQMNQALRPDLSYPECKVAVKFSSSYGESNWLSLTEEQFNKVKEILSEKS